MERGRWIWDESKQDLVPADEYRQPNKSRSSLPSPSVISDQLPDIQGQHDGKIYTSKRALRKSYRQAGMIEVGNDPQRLKPFKKPRPDRKQIRTSVEKAAARFERGERTEAYRRKHP